ncbi:MAG: UvrB/UvrC motif-containing protein [Lachnospiraceae bacterium]|nr:UvrB/UvrC motif-containing protein [Lachnospiraceae bacterium]
MLCEQCNEREATVVIREVAGGVAKERHLCSQCASQSGLGAFLDTGSPFARLLSGILGFGTPEEEQEEDAAMKLTCPSCSTTYGDFVKNSRFGCSECYETFGLLIHDNIKKLQGSDKHVGKRPRYTGCTAEHEKLVTQEKEKESLRDQLEILQAKQQEAVREEDFEAAARYRDEIRSLKERMKNEHEMV